jgi:trimeric autotransporter adhesin
MRRPWKFAAIAAVGLCASSLPVRAAVLYTNDFGNTTNGNLVTDQSTGQAGFVQTGTVVTNPIQVTNGVVSLGTTGQDVSAGFSPVTTGSSVYTSAVATVTSAQATGDYFIHLANNNAGVSFQSRLFAKSGATAGTYLLGIQASSSGVVYGTTELPLNTPITVITRYDIVSGAANDVAAIYVNPTSPVEALNTPYLAATTFTQAENTQTLGAVNLRQGTAANAPAVLVDALGVSTTFAEAVPEPAALGLAGAGVILATRRRRRA